MFLLVELGRSGRSKAIELCKIYKNNITYFSLESDSNFLHPDSFSVLCVFKTMTKFNDPNTTKPKTERERDTDND